MIIAKKSLGQNFLNDFSIANIMIAALDLVKDDLVIEIGPGMGVLTKHFVDKPVSLIALEIDDRLIQKLKDQYKNKPNIEIIYGNVLTWLPQYNPGKAFKLLGSLPYYITSPILHDLVKHVPEISLAVVMVQKEVASKISRLAPDASYFSTFINTFYETEIVQIVHKSAFLPEPKVDSAVLKLVRKSNIAISNELVAKYEGFLHKGFSQPRKMLHKVFKKDGLTTLGLDPTMRPQHIDITTWVNLFDNRKLLL